MPGYRIHIIGESDDPPVTIICEEGEVIADAAERFGVAFRVTCGNGGCGACRAEVVEGVVGYTRPISQKKRIDPATGEVGYELLCRATPVSDLVVRPLHGWKRKGRHAWSEVQMNEFEGGGESCL